MKKLITLFFLCVLISCNETPKDDYLKKIEDYQYKENLKFHDESGSPLTKEDLKTFKKLDFYPIDKKYRIVAKLEKTVDAPIFEMTTTTDRKPLYIKYGTVTFTLDGKEQKIPIYQNKDLDRDPQYIDYLFLPFTDKTSGKESYGGGRYLDVLTTDENPDGTIILDFNKAYNPYCAYNETFSCPLTPEENTLTVAILAGAKNYKKE
ncbi:DUF1684 domain-containing protein [Polaribacter uvawellassae]|uniref:DUF1684 domain-containing protein n=1 Tax=Polaribacter uvawellassae TaxID=3133495 RepID=UPI00321B9C81